MIRVYVSKVLQESWSQARRPDQRWQLFWEKQGVRILNSSLKMDILWVIDQGDIPHWNLGVYTSSSPPISEWFEMSAELGVLGVS